MPILPVVEPDPDTPCETCNSATEIVSQFMTPWDGDVRRRGAVRMNGPTRRCADPKCSSRKT